MAEEIVNQIIAEIIAEDQMTQTLRDARKKIKAFGGDIEKLNKSLTANEKAALEAAAADKRLAKEAKAAAVETKRLDRAARDAAAKGLRDSRKAAKQLATQADKSKKALEGLAQGMALSAINGERLSSVSLAVGVAVGSVIGGAVSLATDALKTYIAQNVRAKEASDNLSKSWEAMQVAAVESKFGTDGVTKALDRNTARMNALTKSLFPAVDQMSKLNAEEEKYVKSGFTDSVQFKLSALGLLVTAADFAIESFDELHDIEKKVSEVSFKNLTDQLKGVGSEIDKIIAKATADSKKLDKEEADAAKRRAKRVAAEAKRKKAEAKRAAAEAKRRQAAADALSRKTLSEILNFEGAIADAKKFRGVLDGIADDLRSLPERLPSLDVAEPVFGAKDVTGFDAEASPFSAEALQQAKEFDAVLSEIEATELTVLDNAASSTSLWLQETVDLTASMQQLAVGGIGVLTDAVGDYITAMVAGEDSTVSFGDAILAGFGNLMKQVGSGMIALSTAALMVETGGIFANPIAGIALGGLLVAGGAVLAGIASKGTGLKGGGGGVADAKGAAGEVIDVITSRIGNGFDRDRDRAGDNIQVIIGERPISDVVVRSVRQAIVNREITSLSPAGQSL